MEFIIGSGNYIVSNLIDKSDNEKKGVGIFSAPSHGKPIDNIAPIPKMKDALCVIWFKDLKSARLFQDHINSICLEMNGYAVDNVLEGEADGTITA